MLAIATFPSYDFADDTNTRVGCGSRGLVYFGNNYGQPLDSVFIMEPFISHYHENFLVAIYNFEYKSLNTCHVSDLIMSSISLFSTNIYFAFNWSTSTIVNCVFRLNYCRSHIRISDRRIKHLIHKLPVSKVYSKI